LRCPVMITVTSSFMSHFVQCPGWSLVTSGCTGAGMEDCP